MGKLTLKQQKFADEYLISGNATEAAVKAGYSKKTARSIGAENLTKPYIRAYVNQRLEEMQSEKVAEQQEVMEYLTSVMRGEEKEEVLRLAGDGCQFATEIQVDANKRIKAAELIGKRYGMWTDKLDVNTATTVVIVDDIDDEE
ncbi:MAG: terminase small subunit [Turicibacter sp.]|nr:terminase small subunit [Turicibacter sp.]